MQRNTVLELLRRSLPPGVDALTVQPDLSLRGTVMPPAASVLDEGTEGFASTATVQADSSGAPAENLTSTRFADTGDLALLREQVADASPPPAPRGYKLIDELGRGGMGIVYRAWQSELEREVALKSIRADAGMAEQFAEAFVAEGRVTGVLDHPNIVPVHELARTEGGEIFLSMKLVRGKSWRRVMSSDKTTVKRNLEILIDVCNAVAFAHSKHVLHRDLKPENVMLGAFGEVLVMDWGLAVSLAPAGERGVAHIPHADEVDYLAGTPCYMAPEMTTCEPGSLSAATDVYLLGGILHEILTGRPTHAGDSAVDTIALASQASAPPELDPSLPEELREICRRALAPEPAGRYASALAFQEALRDHLDHRESIELSDRAWERLREIEEGDTSHETYAELAGIVAAFEQAQLLWADNRSARTGECTARLTFASRASEAGDLGLARSHLEVLGDREWPLSVDDSVRRMLDAVAQREAEARRAERATVRLRQTMLWGGLLLVAVLAVGIVLVWSEKLRADTSAELATTSAEDAKAQAAEAHRQSQRAEASELEARSALADVERLADVKRLTQLKERASELWPAEHAKIQALAGWLDDARELVARCEQHERNLADLRQLGRSSPGMRAEELAAERKQLTRLRAELELRRAHLAAAEGEAAEVLASYVEVLAAEEAELADTVEEAEVHVLPTMELQWRHDVLAELIAELQTFADPEQGLVADVERRLAFARTVRERTIDEHADAWRRAAAEVLEHAATRGLVLAPQEGLIPLGADPDSGLQEFLHLGSHEGELPVRDAGGKLLMDERTGIVLVLVPGGSFLMGAQSEDEEAPNFDGRAHPTEGPVHEVALDAFFIGRHEVTQGQWINCTGSNPSMITSETSPAFGITLLHPVENVSWRQATELLRQQGLAPADRGAMGVRRARRHANALLVGSRA